MGMLDDLPRGVAARGTADQRMPDTAWVDPDRIAQNASFRFDPSRVFLGVVGGQVHDTGTEFYVTGGTPVGIRDDRHTLLCAGSRSGKGRSCIVPTLLEYAGSALVLDPKGELANITARRRAAMGQRVVIVDPFKICAQRLTPLRAGFNPLALLDPESPSLIVDAGLIADALVVIENRGDKDPHWDDSARNFIEGVILHVTTWRGYKDTRTLVTVRRLITTGAVFAYDGEQAEGLPGLRYEMAANAALLIEESENEPEAARRKHLAELGALIEAAANDFFDKPDNERGSVLSTARRHTKFLDYPELRESLTPGEAQEPFALTGLKTAPKGLTVYLCLPAGRMSTCNRWFRLFVNLALEAMERERTKPKIPVLAVLEEFHVLGHMQQIETAAALVAGFGMKLLIVLQDLSQLKRHYREGWETFLGNCGVAVFFGNSDLTTLEFISKRCGQTSLVVTRSSQTTDARRLAGESGTNWSVEVRELVTIEEASRVFGRDGREQRQLVIRAGIPPAIIQRVKYDLHEMFKGKFEPADSG